jgi:hypothetical protein
LRVTDGIGSNCEVNWLIDGLCGQTLPTIDLAHVDLAAPDPCSMLDDRARVIAAREKKRIDGRATFDRVFAPTRAHRSRALYEDVMF